MINSAGGEVIAVISAVIAAQYHKPEHKLEIKAIRRISQTSPVWNTTGKLERLARNMNAF